MVTEYNRNTILRRKMAEAERKPAEPAQIEVKQAEPTAEDVKTETASEKPKKTDAEKLKKGRKKNG